MPPVLIDTNVLVYAFDQNEPDRQERAILVLSRLEQAATGRLSVQCLSEFCTVAMRRLQPPLSAADTLEQVERFLGVYPVHDLTPMVILEAMRGVKDHQLAYYDAQIWAVARLNQIPLIFSEDFHHGVLEGVRIVNPFASDFVIEAWLT